MRMDGREGLTADGIIKTWPESDIADMLWRFGEERHSRRIARAIVQRRENIRTTTELAEVVRRAMPPQAGRDRIHPATRTFQAIRIAVNREMEMLSRGLDAAVERLSPGGRIVVISYHSLEDRIVKQLFRERSTGCICPPRMPICRCGHAATLTNITKKSVTPSEAEVAANPRARSARMRAAERLEDA
jgi:16S rRNA (cytosine1402-N4)-methyltransferase